MLSLGIGKWVGSIIGIQKQLNTIGLNAQKKGSDIGYNRTYKANKDIKVAILQVGYADAGPLEFSNIGFVEYEGKKLNILGKVSMDLICICIDGIDIKKGD